jgi:hypothetical protein
MSVLFLAVAVLFAVSFYVLLHVDVAAVMHRRHRLRRRGNLVFFPPPRTRQHLLRQRLAVESRHAARQARALRLAHPHNPGQTHR